ncbi:enoyl-CoA hydratase-related protein [Leisingera aquaemixtae]|uniref:Enoyl-CoA hydratase n=1 Tax=Leisingera aquaemixtae TaxID=1396826 RepID=A0A0P1HDR8_9RHOB|nr:enoyl-CoA hydratase-related protein [Leisingera aquaemixtae]CUI01861.1 enoyl-CoA hydratase [Leisingera aquaemixtae]
MTKPVIASVNSIAIGEDFELSLFCDITIASDGPRIDYNKVRDLPPAKSLTMK